MRITKTFEEMERPVKFKEDDAMAIDAVRMYAQYVLELPLGIWTLVGALICNYYFYFRVK